MREAGFARRPLPGVARFAGLGLAGGTAMAAAHPPFGLWFLAPASAAAFSAAVVRAGADREALAAGLAFGIGAYGPILGWLATGVDAGNAPVLAYGGALAVVALFAAGPAAIAFLARRSAAPAAVRVSLLVPALWLLVEWSRQFTEFHFPWALLGYTQVPDSPIAPLAPLVGALGLGFVTMAAGGLLALAAAGRRPAERLRPLAALIALLLVARRADTVEWTQPAHAPLSVALLQGAFPTAEKFEPKTVADALRTYAALALDTRAQVDVMPETALPLLEDVLPPGYLAAMERRARHDNRDILATFFRNTPGRRAGYHSSARILGASGPRDYDKRILAPFAEYVPAPALLRPLYERVAAVPMLDTEPGDDAQDPLVLGGVRVALRLCFEDLFAHAHRDEVAQAGFLVVLANDSWNGTDVPMEQHLRVAQARALESAKPLVRVGNTGWTGLIGPDGRLAAEAPLHRRTVLQVSVQPRAGVTPYVRYGDAIPVGLAVLALAAALVARPSDTTAPVAGAPA